MIFKLASFVRFFSTFQYGSLAVFGCLRLFSVFTTGRSQTTTSEIAGYDEFDKQHTRSHRGCPALVGLTYCRIPTEDRK